MNIKETFSNFFKKSKNESPSLTEKTEPLSEDEINKEIEKEKEELNKNFKELQNDIKEFGSQEELAEILEKNPGITKRILDNVSIIAPVLITFNAFFVGSLHQEIANGDFKSLAITLIEIAATSVVIAGIWEGIKTSRSKEKN